MYLTNRQCLYHISKFIYTLLRYWCLWLHGNSYVFKCMKCVSDQGKQN